MVGEKVGNKLNLASGQGVLIDCEDFEYLNQWKWTYWHNSISRSTTKNGKKCTIIMSREIMKPSEGQEVDHINGNALDNRRSNLRLCTKAQNLMNKSLYRNNKSGYKGVCWNKLHKKWYASIGHQGKAIFLGLFGDKQKAAMAYNEKAKELFGEFARLNTT